jgi:diadenosine tetraphosphate (Ap4A) HIT family hydrolase
MHDGCTLCHGQGGLLIWQGSELRVVRVEDAAFPAYYRVIWQAHVAEFSDLGEVEQALCMRVITSVERCIRDNLKPTKVNLASLGNMVPHLHWHVIARFEWDSHFPQPIWSSAQRDVDIARTSELQTQLTQLDAQIQYGLSRLIP